MKSTLFLLLLSWTYPNSAGTGFTPLETGIIGGCPGEVMSLVTIVDEQDSLFLRRTAKPVTRDMAGTEVMQVFSERLLATVNDPWNPGVGIAAPQVGISRRIIAVQRFDKEGEPFEVYLNPEITNYGELTLEGPEGCLSMPGYSGLVERPQYIEVIYNDPVNFQQHSENISGFTAVIFQHECDHLDGILFTDRALPDNIYIDTGD